MAGNNNNHLEQIILSLGGSIIVPNGGIDTQFLKKFNQFIHRQIVSKKRRFFIVCGGGSTCRHYQEAARKVIGEIVDEDVDWLGIHATRLNAHLIRTIFRDIAHPKIIKHYEIIQKVAEPVVVAAGWKPGWSTDYDAVMLCQDYGAKTVINMSNVKMVYDKDPKKYKNARPIKKLSWQEFRATVGAAWVPGMNVPWDPMAAKLAEQLGIKAMILDGRDLRNLDKAMRGKKFVGTVIE